jgi:hypothetical protein
LTSLENKGRMLLLLKEKNKIGIAHKNRKSYEPLMPNKKLKTEPATATDRSQNRTPEEE